MRSNGFELDDSTRRGFLAGAAGLGLALAGCGGDSGGSETASGGAPSGKSLRGTGEVNVNTAGGAFEAAWKPAVIDRFQEETGITVNLVPSSGGTAEIRASLESGAGKFDLFELTPSNATAFQKDGLLAPIDYSYWRPEDRNTIGPIKPSKYTVPWGYYAIAIGYRPSEFKNGTPENWADFWDSGKFTGKRTLYPGTFGAFGPLPEASLLAAGVSDAEIYPADLDRSFQQLDLLRKDILKFAESGEEPVQLLRDGRVTVASAYNTRFQSAIDQGEDIAFTFGQGVRCFDTLCVAAGSDNLENAMKLLAYECRPEPQAELGRRIPYAPSNERAFKLIPRDRLKTLATSPENRDLIFDRDYGWWAENEEQVVQRFQQWSSS